MLTRLGRFTVRRRRLVLSFTVLFMVVAAVLGTRAFGVLEGGGFEDPSSESEQASEVLGRDFDSGSADLVLLATAADSDVDSLAAEAAGVDLAALVAGVAGVTDVSSYWSRGAPASLRSTDGDTAIVLVRIDDADAEAAEIVADVRDVVADDQGGLTVAVGGGEAVDADITETIEGDLARAEVIAIPITLALLVLVFGGLLAASLPLFVGIIAVLGTFLSLYVMGSLTDVSVYAINLTTALGLGLAIDYSLFIVSRYREELRAGRSVEQSVVRAVETAGKTITISALTVAVSLSALLVFPQYFLRSFAYAGIAVVLLAMMASVVALPSLLAVVGHRIDALRIFKRRPREHEEDGFWYRVATRVMRRPVPVALGVIALLLLLGAPFLRVQFGTPDDRVLTESAESRQVSDTLRRNFEGNESESFPIVVPQLGDADAVEAQLSALAGTVSDISGVARVESSGGTFVAGDLAAPGGPESARYAGDGSGWMSVVPTVEMASAEGEDLVRAIRDLDVEREILVGGQAAELVDTKASIGDRLPLAIAVIVIATFVLLFLLSGSVLVPVKALVLNLLSLTATFGAMVWIFQDGNLSGPLGFTATGAIDTSMPILMFCIAFGLSMDYEVFLLSRIKEEHDRTGDNDHAVALGLERSGRIVTAAALLLSVTFFAFGTSGVSFIKMFGIGLGIAVLMDAFVIRGTLVPAFMKLAGEANWWAPGPLRRLHDRFGLHEVTARLHVQGQTGSSTSGSWSTSTVGDRRSRTPDRPTGRLLGQPPRRRVRADWPTLGVMALRSYLVEEITLECSEGVLSRREALRRLGLLGVTGAAATALLASATDDVAATDDSTVPPSTGGSDSTSPVEGEEISFPGSVGDVIGVYSAADSAKGAVLVIHENRGLTPHIRSIPPRLAADGYSALAIDLLSPEGGTASLPGEAEATAALGKAPAERLIADLRAGLDELERREPGAKLAAIGFCFGGGMTWQLLAAGEPRLSAAVPFYGPLPDGADFSGSAAAAVLGVYAELDARVNSTRDAAEAALTDAGLEHELRTFEGVDHAFFNDTGPRYDADAAAAAYAAMLEWFERHLASPS